MANLSTVATHALEKIVVAFPVADPFNISAVIAATSIVLIAFRVVRHSSKGTRLRGPSNPSFLYGVAKDIIKASDPGEIYETWVKEYGVAYEVPVALGQRAIMLFDPKALQHCYARETWTYIALPSVRATLRQVTGKGILWAIGEDHRRQRKYLAPGFSHTAIRNLTSIYYNSAYKAKSAWECILDSVHGDSAIIEVQNWMNHISLDTIGLAGFSHNFGSLDGQLTPVTTILDTLGSAPNRSVLNASWFAISQVVPALVHLPTRRTMLLREMEQTLSKISKELLERTRKEKEAGIVDGKDKSIIELLIKAEDAETGLRMSHEEIVAQMKVLLLAGYETTSISLTWALLELARNPDIQTKLREELLAFPGEANYDQLSSKLPYLDAVVHEILRIHSPVIDLSRVAMEDDAIPLSEPVHTRSGELVDSISVTKGTRIGISIACMNRSSAIWGPDAKKFRPERWLEEAGIPKKAQEIQGYRHLLTFSDGSRTCLGKVFAITEFKVVLSVLVRSFVFEMRDGPDAKVEVGRELLQRPKLAGEVGTKVPLRVRRYEG
ncbi:cytochrome P450 [Pisolithus microcarpus]|nr:cytochrome P450 [Pisolithus microcarpus]